eukprot:168076-Alexandrium_andersonii.AAC.1
MPGTALASTSWSGSSGKEASVPPWLSWRLGGWKWPGSCCTSSRTLLGARLAPPLPPPSLASRPSRL